MAYDRTNTGTIGKNKRKEKDTHPDLSGSLNVEGKEYWLSGWKKQKDGDTFYSLAVKPKEPKNDEKPEASEKAVDSDIPF